MTQVQMKKGGRPTKRPSVEEFNEIRSKMTNKQVAEHYGVALQTIRTWVKAYRKEYENGTQED